MTNVELKYNPYTNETHILVNGKMLPENEVKEYVGAEQEISAWAQNFWERIATKCNDDFTVRFCGLMSDYEVLDKTFLAFRQESSDDVILKPEYIVNPDFIHDEQYVKDELDIMFGKKGVERPVLKDCPDCKKQIPDGSAYCPVCGKKQDGTERIDESRMYVEHYLADNKAGDEMKQNFHALYDQLHALFAEESVQEEVVQTEAVQEEDPEKTRQQATDLYAFNFTRKGKIFKLTGLADTSLTQIVIPDCITELGSSAFQNRSNLKSVVIPDSVTKIGGAAFSGCSNLESVLIPDSVTEIESAAFRRCSSLESVVIPHSVTKIGDNAFEDCSNLESVVIPDSVTEIGWNAFSGCSNLKSVELPYFAQYHDHDWNGHYGSSLRRFFGNSESFPASCKIIKRKQ